MPLIEDALPTAVITAPDRSAILSGLLQRQALRREAHLPLLNIRAEYEQAVEHARWRAHVEEHSEAVRAQVLAELRSRHGPQFGASVGGLWAVHLRTEKQLRDMFTRKA
ncbi:hypothetical protein C0214_17030 [Methylobacterium sp. DM1]|nr:hypothetical protein C0214_17030 [Methylobacterium sp. DM1]